MEPNNDFANRSLGDILAAIASEQPSSGAGVAAALALALAVACASKAAGVSLRHRPDDEALQAARARLQELQDLSLTGAVTDAHLFERYLKEPGSASATRLVTAGAEALHVSRLVHAQIGVLRGRVVEQVRTDVSAAETLHAASLAIADEILRENSRDESSR